MGENNFSEINFLDLTLMVYSQNRVTVRDRVTVKHLPPGKHFSMQTVAILVMSSEPFLRHSSLELGITFPVFKTLIGRHAP